MEPRHNIDETAIDPEKEDIPSLIAQFGDSASTSWLESRYAIWRSPQHSKTAPRVQGYFKSHTSYRIAWGNPLCRPSDLRSVVEEFLAWCHDHHKKPVWACISAELEAVLAEGVPLGGKEIKFNTLSCIREDRLHPEKVDLSKKDIKSNRLKAMRAKVVVDEVEVKGPDFVPAPDIKKAVEDGLEAWRQARTGTQIASSSLLPWIDGKHRRYFVAKDPEHGVVGVCILTPIANESYQVKNSIAFPNAPRGTSEDLLGEVIETMDNEGKKSLTFGASAADEFTPEHNMNVGGWRVKLLKKTYNYIIKKHHLAERGQFRHKFDTEDEPLYVAYPPHGFGIEGLLVLMNGLRT